MDLDKLRSAIETVSEVSTMFSDMPEEKKKAVEAALALTLAQSYLVELLYNLQSGVKPYDAALSTIRGELPIGEPKAT